MPGDLEQPGVSPAKEAGATDGRLAVVVLAAGKGSRMKSELPKVLHPLAGRPMLGHVLATLRTLSPAATVVVVGPGMAAVEAAAVPHAIAIQPGQRGTGEAVMAARPALAEFCARCGGPGEREVLVVFGDTPLVRPETYQAMVAARRRKRTPDLVLLGFRAEDPTGYGRIVLDREGRPQAIVEHRDCDEATRALDLCNAGLMLIDAARLFAWLERIDTDNAKGEYYLTDLARLAHEDGARTALVEADEGEVMGVNSRAELATAEAVLQEALRARAMAEGATLIDPASVWLSWDTHLGRDVTIHPSVVLGPGVTIRDGVEVKGFCHLEGVTLEAGAVVGPYARLRPGTVVGAKARIGNFVEVKNAVFGEGAKANHLSYVGDASVGARANVGAGTITCNYDGFAKSRTEIGEGAFIGSNTALVAPVKVGAGAITGAGSTITRDVPDDAIAIERNRQDTVEQGALRFRESRSGSPAASGASRPLKQNEG